MNVFDYVNAINAGKDLTLDRVESFTDYAPFVVNTAFSFHLDTILYANELNMNGQIPPRSQFHFYVKSVRPQRRSGWIKKTPNEDVKKVMRVMNLSYVKALSALEVISPEQLDYIRRAYEASL